MMPMVNSLAGLKRHFQSGHGCELIKFVWHDKEAPHKYLNVVRHPIKVQTNSVMLDGGSWLDYGKASEWEFLQEDEYTVAVNDNGFSVLYYKLVD